LYQKLRLEPEKTAVFERKPPFFYWQNAVSPAFC